MVDEVQSDEEKKAALLESISMQKEVTQQFKKQLVDLASQNDMLQSAANRQLACMKDFAPQFEQGEQLLERLRQVSKL